MAYSGGKLAHASMEDIRDLAEKDLLTFIKLVAPHRVIPHFQEDWIRWMQKPDASTHQLALLPRDHAKSTIIAYRAAQRIVRDPTIRILYISSTANLAEKQLGLIKQILTSSAVRRYWPDLVNAEEGKREKWTLSEISVDHPKRKEEGIRDPTVFTGGLTTSLTGMHCDIAILDDVVVQENAYTDEGREKVKSQYSLLASIEGANAEEWVVGTRYHPKDLYGELVAMEEEVFDSEGNPTSTRAVYEIFQRVVEENGEFLWPRQQRPTDGKWFGFDIGILAKKKAQYLDKTQFYAQYYNDPNKYENAQITPDKFQYFERNHVKMVDGKWQVRGKPVNVVAAMDFAFTETKGADYTAIAVVGVDKDNNYYVLDLDRFKTERIDVMYSHLRSLHDKWQFRKVLMEMTVAQATVARELREQYIKKDGLALAVEEYYPSKKREGDKAERLAATLAPRYTNLQMWHYRGGHTQSLEDELLQRFPAHDDLSDAVCNAVRILVPPSGRQRTSSNVVNFQPRTRFGGV